MLQGDRVIRTININPDGVVIEYLDARTDVRKNGLTRNHIVFIPFGEDYEDELEELIEAAQRALSDALEDFENLDPVDPREQIQDLAGQLAFEDDDDDEGTEDDQDASRQRESTPG